MSRIVSLVREFLVTRSGYGILAVSGGADSVAMLRAVADLRRPVLVAHVNHGWRGSESDADEAFVVSLAESLDLPIQTIRVTCDRTENAARLARYEWLSSLANETAAAWVATAHTLDDQAETVLHRLIRGSGIQGLRGIAVDRPFANQSRLVRPLLRCSRQEIRNYLASLSQAYRVDISNADTAFTRNRIRAEVLPLLVSFNPDIVASLARTAEQAEETFAILDENAKAFARQVELPRTDRLVLDASKLKTMDDVRLRDLVRHLWQREGWPIANMDAAAWQRTARVAKGIDSAWDFPHGVRMEHLGRVVHLGRES